MLANPAFRSGVARGKQRETRSVDEAQALRAPKRTGRDDEPCFMAVRKVSLGWCHRVQQELRTSDHARSDHRVLPPSNVFERNNPQSPTREKRELKIWQAVVERFEHTCAASVMAAVDKALPAQWIAQVFHGHRRRQYPCKLLSSRRTCAQRPTSSRWPGSRVPRPGGLWLPPQ